MPINNTKITTKMTCWRNPVKGGVICITLLLLLISCDSSNITNDITDKGDQEISQIDGKPILQVQASDLTNSSILADVRNRLAAKHGSAIVKALNTSDQSGNQISKSILASKLNTVVQRKGEAPEVGSTHFRVIDADGETEDFVLSLRRYLQHPGQVTQKGAAQLKSSTTYLALSPDRFYLEDDANGNEQWPVTFPAVAMDDPSNQIEVTFNKDGFVSSSLASGSKTKTMSEQSSPDLVFAEGTPVVTPNYVTDPCEIDPESCGGGGGTPEREDDNSRGDDPRTPNEPGLYPPERTYFVVHSIKLASEGDGDGATDLQMFVQKSDNYGGQNMPLQYRYRFDNAWRVDPTSGFPSNNTKIKGADRHVYEVPDINTEGIDYPFVKRWVSPVGSDHWGVVITGFFPLIDLSSHPGNWRVVMSDDDKDYQDFSRRRQSEYHPNIQTYGMSSGTYSSVETGFTVNRKTYGSSDDPRLGSGVRKIAINNVQSQMYSGQVVVQTQVDGKQFKYVFGLETYNPIY